MDTAAIAKRTMKFGPSSVTWIKSQGLINLRFTQCSRRTLGLTIVICASTLHADRELWPLERAASDEVTIAAGPDVIVGELAGAIRWGTVGGITAYSIGTVSCNMGDAPLNWIANTSDHPVIAQNMYRLKDGRMEQIGMSWLKHGFFAFSETWCSGPGQCQADPSGSHLGVGCSDPYAPSHNGTQASLGPRSQVNPHTGGFPFPFTAPPPPQFIGRRLQVHNSDLAPAQNAGALYFLEGQYIATDDAQSDNGNNNASYRQATISEFNFGVYELTFVSSTQREQPAIRAWKSFDSDVMESDVQIPDDGLMIVASSATDLGNGYWRYEYAAQNLNSDRAAKSFRIPLTEYVDIQNIGFHDVDYHSGEPYDGADWPPTRVGQSITWSTSGFGLNPYANALRWGSLYNFRFDADQPPVESVVTIGLFKPGAPNLVFALIKAPRLYIDCNGNGLHDPCEIHCDSGDPACDGLDCGTSPDCNYNDVPDECELDTDGDGIIDECDDCTTHGRRTPATCFQRP